MTGWKVADDKSFAWWKCSNVRMKGLLLFSQSGDLLFIDADQEFLDSAYKNEEAEGGDKVKLFFFLDRYGFIFYMVLFLTTDTI